MYPDTINHPHILLISPVRPDFNKELYHFCLLFFFLSVAGFSCNYMMAQVVTSVLHNTETKLESVHWYWNRYAGILRVLFAVSGSLSLLYVLYAKRKMYLMRRSFVIGG